MIRPSEKNESGVVWDEVDVLLHPIVCIYARVCIIFEYHDKRESLISCLFYDVDMRSGAVLYDRKSFVLATLVQPRHWDSIEISLEYGVKNIESFLIYRYHKRIAKYIAH